MNGITKILTALLLVLLAQVAFAVPPIEITSCGYDTSAPGETLLVIQDLTLTSGTHCIIIDQPEVTLDCDHHRLTGPGSSGVGDNYGVYIADGGDGVTVTNCDIYGFHYGIYLDNAAGNIVQSNKVDDNYYGIFLWDSDENYVEDNRVSDGYVGISIYTDSDSNFVRRNLVDDYDYGILLSNAELNTVERNRVVGASGSGLWLIAHSDWNTVFGNKGEDNNKGIYVWDSNNNDFYENAMHRSSSGIWCGSGESNDFEDNQANWNTEYGFYIEICEDSEILRNTANMNAYGIRLDGSGTDNTVNHNTFNRNDDYGIWNQGATNTFDGNVCKNNGDGPFFPTTGSCDP